MTVQKLVFIRNKFISCQEFNSKYSWANIPTEEEDERNLPEKCVSIYYSVNIEQQTIEKLYMVSYAPQYKPSFKEISVAWVNEYFAVEPADLLQLDHPEENIIQPGGEIFCLMKEKGEVVGTVAMIIDQEEEGAVELGKMGVAKEFCGKGYAHPLMKEALMWAQKKSFSVVNLHTAAKLIVAVSLYEKYGFKPVPFQAHGHFARVDLLMRLTF
ncbi:acyl-CoA N-acyltransferase [Pilaira anomala]|nr:acyl-CoA N-acyltransferase [Pilaira anomala]